MPAARRLSAVATHIGGAAASVDTQQAEEFIVERRLKSSIAEDNDHPYMSGLFAPNIVEVTQERLVVIEGEIPHDISGVYIRNTEQPTHEPRGGNYHPFDGDAMLHQVSFHEGACSYRNRFVNTVGFEAEQEAGEALWVGVSERKAESLRAGWGMVGVLKDTSSTDVVVHAGRVLTMFYRCGEARVISDCHFAVQLNHFIPGFLSYSVAVFLE
jgi:carotenoid cleavage dioxygenase